MNEFLSRHGIFIDLVDYLIYRGFPVVKSGKSYRIKVDRKYSGDFSSLSIFPDRQRWKRWSDGTHGENVINFCQIIYGMSFQEAVQELGGGLVHVQNVPTDNEMQVCDGLMLPERFQGRFSRLYAYLIQTRGLAPEIINNLVDNDYIYQDVRGNIIFLGRDEFQQVRFACQHGTSTSVDYKKDCYRSDKRFAFSVAGTDRTSLYIFESPIDLLSAATLANRITGNQNEWLKHSRLSLSGVSDVALSHYLVAHQQVSDLHFWLDNDSTGREASENLCRKYSEQGFKVYNHCPQHKDMNEDLKEWLRIKK